MIRLINTTLLIYTFSFLLSCAGGKETLLMDSKVTSEKEVAGGQVYSYPPQQAENLKISHASPPYFYVPMNILESKHFVLPTRLELNTKSEEPNQVIMIPGYRIQMFSGKDPDAANWFIKKLSEITDLESYLDYEAPLYKVRLGDFPNRESAMIDCKEIRDKGYPDAWVVRTSVKSR